MQKMRMLLYCLIHKNYSSATYLFLYYVLKMRYLQSTYRRYILEL